ncbi:gtp-binding protein sar1 [Quercus suber]|uniref:Gtp-binding protein sar1 n=1 Tax=Quercus suber TaxID=58331 RepID=A0AAW0JAY0_QUESU
MIMEIAQLQLVMLSLILSAMVFKVSHVETKPIDGQKPGTSRLNKKRLVQQQLTQYPTSEELSIGKIKFKAFDLGGHQIARRVWKENLRAPIMVEMFNSTS